MLGPGRSRSLLVERFDRVRRDRPEHVVVLALGEGRAIRAGEVWRAFETWRAAIGAAALPPGSAVLSVLGNHAALFPFLLATRDLGLVPVLADSAPTPHELDGLLRALRPSAVVARPGGRAPEAGTEQALPDGMRLHLAPPTAGEPAAPAADLLKLTSGSTGAPKAIACREHSLVTDSEQISEAMGIRPDDVNLAAIPLGHAYGIGNVVLPLLLQGTAVALREAFAPDRFCDDVSRHGVTLLPGVPYHYDHLLRRLGDAAPPASLRLLLTAGARIRLDTVHGCQRAWGRKIHSFYGASEAGGITFDDAPEIDETLPVGRPLPGVEVTIEPDHGADDGLIHVRSAAVAAGYALGGEDAAPSGFVDGGFRTGDRGRFRGDTLWLTGRTTRFLNVAGRKVQPAEIERVLLELPEVAAARVFGIGSRARGEAVAACLVLAAGASIGLGAVRGHCARRLSPHKVPRRIVLADGLPVDARGKTSERALRALVDGQRAGAPDGGQPAAGPG